MDKKKFDELLHDGIAMMQQKHFHSAIALFTQADDLDNDNPIPSLLHASCLLLSYANNMSDEEKDHIYRTANELISTANQRNGKAWDKIPETYPLR